jgi:hypothetical protein
MRHLVFGSHLLLWAHLILACGSTPLRVAPAPHASDPEPADTRPVVRVSAPRVVVPGTLTELRVDVTPALNGVEDPAEPGPALRLRFAYPDGRARELVLPLRGEVRCAYCLPTPDRPHCEHDCRSDAFSGRSLNISGYLTGPGPIDVDAELVGLDARLEGAPLTIEVGVRR